MGLNRTDEKWIAFSKKIAHEKVEQGEKLIILPENTLRVFNNKLRKSWEPVAKLAQKNKSAVIVGAEGFYPLLKAEYGFILIHDGKMRFFPVVQPMPLIGWDPFNLFSAEAKWFHRNVFSIQNYSFVVSVCYEGNIAWPILFAMVKKPDVLISIANLEWSNRFVKYSQEFTLQSYARLFHLSLLRAVNY